MPALRSERGAVTVMFALLLPTIVLFLSLVVDYGNFAVHKRHLQIQADAAALAGGSKFQPLGCNSGNILAEAHLYSGDTSTDYNQQVGTGGDAPISVKDNADPCTDFAIDETVNETNIPWYIKAISAIGVDETANARVEMKAADNVVNVLPLALEDDHPTWVTFTLVDRDTGATIGLPVTDTTGDVGVFTAQMPLTTDHTRVDVRTAVGYANAKVGDPCTDSDVDCSYQDTGNVGVTHIQTFPQPTTTPANDEPPNLKNLTLTPAVGCGSNDDGYVVTSGCRLKVHADIDFAPAVGSTVATKTANAAVTATIDGNNVTLLPMLDGSWEGIAANGITSAGPSGVTLKWEQTTNKIAGKPCHANGNNSDCKGVFTSGAYNGSTTATATSLHQVFVRDSTASGSIKYLHVDVPISDAERNVSSGSNSFLACTVGCVAHQLLLTMGLPAGFQAGDPFTKLDISSNRGFIACGFANGTPGIRQGFQQGCPGPFEVYDTGACNTTTTPYDCVSSQSTTGKNDNVVDSLNQRIYGTMNPSKVPGAECSQHTNYYATHDPKTQPPPFGDTRVVSALLVPKGSLSASGGTTWPIIELGTFYLTGWVNEPCGAAFGNVATVTPEIAGYFISYSLFNSTGTGSGTCKAGALNPCIPIMTK